MFGAVEVNRIPGNIHFSFHEFEAVAHKLREQNVKPIDLSHRVNKFQFDEGATNELVRIKKKFGDDSPINPLDRTSMKVGEGNNNFVYFLNVIRTVYNERGKANHTLDQYTSSKYTSRIHDSAIPAVYMRFDIAPIYVYYTFRENSVMHFLVRIIAIIGGVITVAGIAVSFLQSSVYHFIKTAKQ